MKNIFALATIAMGTIIATKNPFAANEKKIITNYKIQEVDFDGCESGRMVDLVSFSEKYSVTMHNIKAKFNIIGCHCTFRMIQMLFDIEDLKNTICTDLETGAQFSFWDIVTKGFDTDVTASEFIGFSIKLDTIDEAWLLSMIGNNQNKFELTLSEANFIFHRSGTAIVREDVTTGDKKLQPTVLFHSIEDLKLIVSDEM